MPQLRSVHRFLYSGILLAFVPTWTLAQIDYSDYPYLLRIEHKTGGTRACALLQRSGAFHLEIENADITKVYEGSVGEGGMQELGDDLSDNTLASLSQKQIEEPVIGGLDALQLDIFRQDHWQDLIFYSPESQEPYRQSLRPLVRWLDDLHKLPHKEFSEEERRSNCLPARKLVLQRRDTEAGAAKAGPSDASDWTMPSRDGRIWNAPAPTLPIRGFGRIGAPQGSSAQSPLPTGGTQAESPPAVAAQNLTPPLVLAFGFGMGSSVAFKKCVVVDANGSFRAEKETQKTGAKSVDTEVAGGTLDPDDLARLRQLLDDSAISKIRHHLTSRATLPVYGEMLDLRISRPAGIQQIVLSSSFGDPKLPFFYSGDGDIRHAHSLMNFLDQRIEAVKLKSSDPALRNSCQSAR